MQVTKTPAFIASRKFAQASYSRAFFQVGHTLALYVVTIGLMFASLSLPYGVTLVLSLVAAAAYLRLFMIGHDCSHGSYLPKKWQNSLLGNMIGVLTNTPLQYWGTQHAMHHRSTGNLDKRGDGDVVTRTVEEYQASGWFSRLCYRVYRNPWVLFFFSAPLHFVVLQRLPLGEQARTWSGWRSVMGTNLGICIYYGSLIAFFGLTPFLLVYVPVVMLSSLGAVWLFYVQHQFEDAYWARNGEWNYHDATLQGSSFYDLPRWLHWVSGNIGYHHIHHLNPKVPNYNLPDCYAQQPALQDARKLGLMESLSTAWLALWDEKAGRLVSFTSLKS
ncbi:MAG: omega-6 fatty acid desaturase (delta-12 desaturase) [Candidatus Pseudothioglobus sp.]|jgi:omega-6 fatty acid desaturase (delta-12 desaturase)